MQVLLTLHGCLQAWTVTVALSGVGVCGCTLIFRASSGVIGMSVLLYKVLSCLDLCLKSKV